MALSLTSADFPLYSVGAFVYARTQSSPILTAMDDQMAVNIALRLNRDEGLESPSAAARDDDRRGSLSLADIIEKHLAERGRS